MRGALEPNAPGPRMSATELKSLTLSAFDFETVVKAAPPRWQAAWGARFQTSSQDLLPVHDQDS